jgi:hypothetical protein
MAVQPHLFPETPQATPAAPPAPPPAPAPPAGASPGPIWLQRISLFILVLFCVYIGAFVTYLPWWKDIWDDNNFFQAHPQLWAILRLGPVRGIISGLGLIDIWIGISEAVHYRETPRN